jgi:flagellar biogenesis protein FliO
MNGMWGYGVSLLLLSVIVAGAVVLAWRRRGGGAVGKRMGNQLRALEFAPLGPNDRLVLAECDGKRYLLAQGVRGVTLIDRLADSPPAPALAAPAAVSIDAAVGRLAA